MNREITHERPDPRACAISRSALQTHPAVSAGRGQDAVSQDHQRRRAGRDRDGQGDAGGDARGAARALGSRVRRHQSLSAAGTPRAASQDPRRPGGQRQRQVRGVRFSQERQHRRRRHPADVPGHRHRDHHGQEGLSRHHRGRRRGRIERGRARRLSAPQPALFAGGALVDVRGEEHRQQHARAMRDLRGRRRRLQVHVHGQGRRLR